MVGGGSGRSVSHTPAWPLPKRGSQGSRGSVGPCPSLNGSRGLSSHSQGAHVWRGPPLLPCPASGAVGPRTPSQRLPSTPHRFSLLALPTKTRLWEPRRLWHQELLAGVLFSLFCPPCALGCLREPGLLGLGQSLGTDPEFHALNPGGEEAGEGGYRTRWSEDYFRKAQVLRVEREAGAHHTEIPTGLVMDFALHPKTMGKTEDSQSSRAGGLIALVIFTGHKSQGGTG